MRIRHIQALLLSILALLLISCSSNPIKSAADVTHEFDAKGTTQDLVTKTLVWIEKNPIIDQSTLQMHYQEKGYIVGSGMTKVVNSFELKEVYSFTMQIDIQENHAKIRFNNLLLKEGSMRGAVEESIKGIKDNLTKIATAYEAAMTTP